MKRNRIPAGRDTELVDKEGQEFFFIHHAYECRKRKSLFRREAIATINDIAKIASVDKSTVSRALHNDNRISREVIDKIQRIAKELNYYPDASAYSLKKKMNHSITLVLPALNFAGGEFFQEIIRGIDTMLEKNSFTLLFSKYAAAENSFYRIMKERRIDGAILFGDVFTTQELEMMSNFNLPIVVVNYRIQQPLKNLTDIYSDNVQGGFLAGEHLIKVHRRKNILFLGGGDKYQANVLRLKGLMNSAGQHGVNVDVMNGQFETGYLDGERILTELISQKRFVYDAIFAASDTLAVGAMNTLLKNMLKVPDEISVVAYDNTQIAGFYPLPISSMEQSAYQMGVKATEILLNKILLKDKVQDFGSIRVVPELVIRRSCGCMPDNH